MRRRKQAVVPMTSKSCPQRRLDLSDVDWMRRIYTMLVFCAACHIGTVAALVGFVLR